MKLQKLAYLSQGWCLAFTGLPLIESDFEAWAYGPVVPELYQDFKEWRSRGITKRLAIETTLPAPAPVEVAVLDEVWKTYRMQSGMQLSTLTHEPGSAWALARQNARYWYSPVIPKESIRQEFLLRQQKNGNLV